VEKHRIHKKLLVLVLEAHSRCNCSVCIWIHRNSRCPEQNTQCI